MNFHEQEFNKYITKDGRIDPFFKEQVEDALIILKMFLGKLPVQKGCASCQHMKTNDGKTIVCGVVDDTPPIHIQQKGCEEWLFRDEIPFV